ncbi:protein yippee-like 2-like [Rhodotorula toruloides]|uniref:Protein yippee-like n=1 Tax=Rhodotorula toruloides TaxID=5286 RepID=A0A2T0A828_RHOTO|nr:protein yippee-like 2-like [Rhodotorula toruloides]
MSTDLNHSDAHTFLPPTVPSFACGTCGLEVALQDELVSRSFQGTSGPAYLFRTAVNVDIGTKTSKQLLSGKHVISPIHCSGCSTELGWKYFVSPDSSQKYKEGKCILEKSKIYKDNKWSLDD